MRLLTLLALFLTTTGCLVYTSDDANGRDNNGRDNDDLITFETVDNYSPEILWAEAGCYWDNANVDDIWYFETDVDDPDGVFDITAVWADVYDEWDGTLVESFELFSTDDPYVWFSDWLGSSTWLDCFYQDYTVDIVAYDALDAIDWLTIVPSTY